MATITMLKSKIHRATVTEADIDYVGSITIDEDLLDESGILEYEKVQIVDVNNGSRFETYTIKYSASFPVVQRLSFSHTVGRAYRCHCVSHQAGNCHTSCAI